MFRFRRGQLIFSRLFRLVCNFRRRQQQFFLGITKRLRQQLFCDFLHLCLQSQHDIASAHGPSHDLGRDDTLSSITHDSAKA